MVKQSILAGLTAGLLVAAGGPVPRKATELRIQTAPGKFISTTQYPGKTLVVLFVLTDCEECQQTSGILSRIQREYSARGVQVLGVAVDVMAAMRVEDFRKKYAVAFPLGYSSQDDQAKFMAYPPKVPMYMPGIVIIDSKGIIRAQYDGQDKALAASDRAKNLRFKLDEVLKDSQPASHASAEGKEKKQ